eukprot:CAMPEP_0179068408 /NCGR_PEP_ID=MMETSP0796-20121207/29987_1 /TAXON_ID=73915 /ORGANISM="Pyrodinium bahamense, Strain pbaha01" /LENGTH=510 /DNA_ID=CAMNT_0020765463 /DNA_START=109 /DNA_END=1641 /DNA_ORIENTATION=-
MLASTPFAIGDIAKVLVADERSDGYLASRVGDRVEVLAVEGSWVFAQRIAASAKDSVGWMAAANLWPTACCVGEIADVVKATERADGYLATRVGDDIEVRYAEHDGTVCSWVYARRLAAEPTSVEGWVAAVRLQLVCSCSAVIRVGARATAVRAVPAPLPGYLAVQIGEHLEILHVGRAHEEEGWIFARKQRRPEPRQQGWVMASAIRPFALPVQLDSASGITQPVAAGTAAARVPAPPVSPRPLLPELPSRPGPEQLWPAPAPSSTASRQACREMPGVRAHTDAVAVVKDCERLCADAGQIADPKAARPEACAQVCGKLQLLTFGLENCDNELVNRCMDWPKGGAEARLSDEELHKALGRLGFKRVDLIFDARKFPDFRAQTLTRHIGVHPEIISRITQHVHFPRYMRDVRRQWSRTLSLCMMGQRGVPTELVVAVYCRQGKHRSVAVAECIRHIAETVEHFHVQEVQHLSKARWGKNVCKGGCEECRDFSAQRQSALHRAEKIWRESC